MMIGVGLTLGTGRVGSRVVARIALLVVVAIAGAAFTRCDGAVPVDPPVDQPVDPPVDQPVDPPIDQPPDPPIDQPPDPPIDQPVPADGAKLSVEEIRVSDSNPVAGAAFELSVTVRNTGPGAAPATTLRFFRSADDVVTVADSPAGTVEVPALGVGRSAEGLVQLTAPANAGTYHYGACVDGVGATCSTAAQVEVLDVSGGPRAPRAPGVDLRVTFWVTDTDLAPDETLHLRARVHNDGTEPTPATTLRFMNDDGQIHAHRLKPLGASMSAYVVHVTTSVKRGFTELDYRACVDAVAGERATDNNCSPPVRITTSQPVGNSDLFIRSTRIAVSDDQPVYVNQPLVMTVTVGNRGIGASSWTTLRVYVSDDDTVPASTRTQVATREVRTVPAPTPGPGHVHSIRKQITVSLVAPRRGGTWYYLACVDAVATELDTTDNCGEPVKLVVNPGVPDLTIAVTGPTPSSAASPGDTVIIRLWIRNVGQEASGSTTVRIYRSADQTIDSTDLELGNATVRGISAGDGFIVPVDVIAHETPGTYYVGACVDAAPQEVNTANNCSSAVTIIVQA